MKVTRTLMAPASVLTLALGVSAGPAAGAAPTATARAVAEQTSALISALHLGPTAVLGRSMGGMVAQALAAQGSAIDRWFAGSDAAGRKVPSLQAPVLVADGTEDALGPVSNDRQLAGLVKGAQLALYPGAGHAFWFQDEGAFVPRVERFLR